MLSDMAIIKMNGVVTNEADSKSISLIPKVDINEPATVNPINPITSDPYTETTVLESVPKLDTETYNEYFERLKVVVNKIQPIPDYKLDLDYDALVILNSYERTGNVDGSLSLKDLLAAIKGTYNNISNIVSKNDSIYQTAITQNAEQIALIASKTTVNEREISRVEGGIKVSADALKLYVDSQTSTVNGRVDQLSQVVIDQEGIILSSVKNEINSFNNYISRNYATLFVLNDRIKSLVGKEAFDALGNIVTKQQSTITQTADAILLKVSKEEFNALGDVVSKQGTVIDQTAESITLKADSSYVASINDKVVTLDGAVKSMGETVVDQSAQLTVMSNAINARVTTETFNAYRNTVSNSYLTISAHDIALGATNTTIDNLKGRVSDTESAILLKADQISLNVTNKTVNDLGQTVSSQGSKIDQTANKISLLVSADNQILAGVIVDAINGGTVKIAAKNVIIDGTTTFANGYNPADKNRLYVTDYFKDPVTNLSKDPLANITNAERELRLGDQWEAIDWELVNGVVTYTGTKRKTFKKEGTSYVWVLNETVISAGLITTGKIKADVIDIEELFAQKITATNLHVKNGYVGDFEINSSLTGRNGNNTIVLNPKIPSIVLTDSDEKTVTLKTGPLSSVDSLIGNNYKFYNTAYPANSYNDIVAILPSTLRSNTINFNSIAYYNKYVNLVSGGAYATIINTIPSTYFVLPATVNTKYTIVTPVHLRQKHSLEKGDSGKYHKRRGTIKYEVRVCIKNNAGTIVSDGYSIRTDEVFINQEDINNIDFYSVHRQQVTVPAGGGSYYIHVEVKLAGDIQYQVWNNPTFGSSYWSTSDGVNKTLQFDLTLDTGLAVNAAKGKTELTTNGFQSVWTANTYFRIDGDNAGAGFIESKGSWRHNGYEVLVDKSGTLSGQFNPGDYVLGSYLSTNYTTTANSDAKYAKKAGDSTQDFTVKNLIIYGTVNHWLGDTITVEDSNLQLNRQQSGATVASGIVIFNKDTSTEVSKLQYNVNGVWNIDGNRIPTIDINPLSNGIVHWDTATSKFIARASAADSDKLGGIAAITYARKDRDEIFTGNVTALKFITNRFDILNNNDLKYHLAYFNGGLSFTESTVADYRIFIKDGGNVGIGTSTASEKLEVAGNIKSSGSLNIAGTGLFNSPVTINMSSPDGIIIKRTAAAGAYALYNQNNQTVLGWRVGAHLDGSFDWQSVNSGTGTSKAKLGTNGFLNLFGITLSNTILNDITQNRAKFYYGESGISDTPYGVVLDMTDSGETYRNLIARTNVFITGNLKAIGKGLFASDLETTTVQFVTGFGGRGWKLDAATNHLTVDRLTVRDIMNVYELVINQIRASNGSFWFSDSIKVVANQLVDSNLRYRLFINKDTSNTLVINDIVKAQQFDGRNVRTFIGTVTRIDTVTTTDYASSIPVVTPLQGTPWDNMDLVRIGNTESISNRQGTIYITSSDDGAPYMDVLDGVNSASLAGKTRLRVGKLLGIPGQSGYGIWGSTDGVKEAFVISSAGYARIFGWNIGHHQDDANQPIITSPNGKLGIYSHLTMSNYNYISVGKSGWLDTPNMVLFGQQGSFTGIKGTNAGNIVFQLDLASNQHKLANWNFDKDKLWWSNIGVLDYNVNHRSLVIGDMWNNGIPGFYTVMKDDANYSNVSIGKLLRHGNAWLDNFGINAWFNNQTYFEVSKHLTTGVITANLAGCNFDAGSIWSANNKWRLNADGSGYFGDGKISWLKDGKTTIDSSLTAQSLIGQVLKSDNWDSSNGALGIHFNLNGGVLNVSNQIMIKPATNNTYADISVLNPESGSQGISISPNPLKVIVTGADGSGTITCPTTNYELSTGLSGEGIFKTSLNTNGYFNIEGFTTKTSLINGNTYNVSIPPMFIKSADTGNVSDGNDLPYMPGVHISVTCRIDVINTYNNNILGYTDFSVSSYSEEGLGVLTLETPKKVISFATQSVNSTSVSIRFSLYIEAGRSYRDDGFTKYFNYKSSISISFKTGGVVEFSAVNGITELSTKGIQFIANNTFFKVEDDTVNGVNDARPFINSNGAFKLTGCDPRNSSVFPIICVAQVYIPNGTPQVLRWSGPSSVCPIIAGSRISTGIASFSFNQTALQQMGVTITSGNDYVIIGTASDDPHIPRSSWRAADSFRIGMFDDSTAEDGFNGFIIIMLTKMK